MRNLVHEQEHFGGSCVQEELTLGNIRRIFFSSISSSRFAMTGNVFNIQRFSVNDGPGIRTTVFLKGCPLHCRWCHNPESIDPSPQLVLRDDRCIRCGDCFAFCKNHAVQRLNGDFQTVRAVCIKCGECVEICNADAREIAGKEMSTEEVIK